MGCFDLMEFCLTEDMRLQKIQSRRLDSLIKESKRQQRNQIKLLLLGTGESGKSTFIRQMRIIYDEGYSDEEKMSYIKLILQNILNSVKAMVEAMQFLDIKYEYKTNLRNAERIRSASSCDFVHEIYMYAAAIKELWRDAGIQECYMRRREYQLSDSTKYYLSDIDRIAKADYLPTEEDILHMRVPTTGLVEYQFKIKNVDFRMIDVGGQRSERRKWMHCFDNVKVIIFLVAISEYDQVLLESNQRNRLIESRDVFNSICNYEWFSGTSFVVFFNKIDLLQEKIMYSDLATFFPDFQGPRHDYLAARAFIEDMFLKLTPQRNIYKHFTCATDTENIAVVFAIVRDTILTHHLDGSLL